MEQGCLLRLTPGTCPLPACRGIAVGRVGASDAGVGKNRLTIDCFDRVSGRSTLSFLSPSSCGCCWDFCAVGGNLGADGAGVGSPGLVKGWLTGGFVVAGWLCSGCWGFGTLCSDGAGGRVGANGVRACEPGLADDWLTGGLVVAGWLCGGCWGMVVDGIGGWD